MKGAAGVCIYVFVFQQIQACFLAWLVRWCFFAMGQREMPGCAAPKGWVTTLVLTLPKREHLNGM
jgi:hypothetical protein